MQVELMQQALEGAFVRGSVEFPRPKNTPCLIQRAIQGHPIVRRRIQLHAAMGFLCRSEMRGAAIATSGQ
jgi:hypothetical protein